MSLITKQELDSIWSSRKATFSHRSAELVLKEASASFDPSKTYDIFLSHCFKDKETIVGLREYITSLGYSVYVDWIDDAQLDRSKVTKETAALLKERMKNCRSLLYAISMNSSGSVWMPWELGFFDGIKAGRVAILPIAETNQASDNFKGQEYLGLYPFITKGVNQFGTMRLWVRTDVSAHVVFGDWLLGKDPYIHK